MKTEPDKPRRGRPRIEDRRKTITAQKPWKRLGMSRATWYRRQAEKRNPEGQYPIEIDVTFSDGTP